MLLQLNLYIITIFFFVLNYKDTDKLTYSKSFSDGSASTVTESVATCTVDSE